MHYERLSSRHERIRSLTALSLLGSIALAGCSAGDHRQQADGPVPDMEGCELPAYQAPEDDGSPEDPEGSIEDQDPKNPISLEDLFQINVEDIQTQFANFTEIARHELEESGITISVYSDDKLMLEPELFETVLTAPFEVDYNIPRLEATLDCQEERLASGEFRGHELRYIISSDPKKCIKNLQFMPRGFNSDGTRSSCHATGGSVPMRIEELSVLQDMMEHFITLERTVHPIFVAIGATSIQDYEDWLQDNSEDEFATLATTSSPPPVASDPVAELDRIFRHETYHTLRWMMGATYSVSTWSIEENLIRHITTHSTALARHEYDGKWPVSYTCEALAEWPEASADC